MSITAGHLTGASWQPTWQQPTRQRPTRQRPNRQRPNRQQSIQPRPRAGVRPAAARIRWGRVAVLVAIVAMAVLLGAGIRAATAGPARSHDGAAVARETALTEHVVRPGDTIWGLAQALDPEADPRPMVDRIMRLNGLQTSEVELGRVLLLPSRP